MTGIREYNVLENNGAGAHQAVNHVHFHIIPKPGPSQGLGIGWPQQGFDHQAGGRVGREAARRGGLSA